MSKQLVSLSKFLSLVLRHRPEMIGLRLDKEGWASIADLLKNAKVRGHDITWDLLQEVVATSDKRRFSISDDGHRIRANQGHSIAAVDLDMPASQPPKLLYHGTVAGVIPSIQKQGLKKRSRNHVHLSTEVETARQVGARRGNSVVLGVRAGEMHAAGYKFFLSVNGVWLTEEVPASFIEF